MDRPCEIFEAVLLDPQTLSFPIAVPLLNCSHAPHLDHERTCKQCLELLEPHCTNVQVNMCQFRYPWSCQNFIILNSSELHVDFPGLQPGPSCRGHEF